jgi:hypothetical protein
MKSIVVMKVTFYLILFCKENNTEISKNESYASRWTAPMSCGMQLAQNWMKTTGSAFTTGGCQWEVSEAI